MDAVIEEIKKGLAATPWGLIKLLALAIVVWLLAGTYWGNTIRCKTFDADGCKAQIELDLASCRHDGQVETAAGSAWKSLRPGGEGGGSGGSLIRYTADIRNVGVSSVEVLSIEPRFLENGEESGSFAYYGSGLDVDKSTRTIELDHQDFELSDTRSSKEKVKAGFMSQYTTLDDGDLVSAELIVRCEGCLEPFTVFRDDERIFEEVPRCSD